MKIIKEITKDNYGDNDKILLVYKDIGETSHDVVDKIRKLFNTRKVGHSGVLDPFAEGLLIIGINKGTKDIWKMEDENKGYEFEMIFGIQTLSGDNQDKILKMTSLNTLPDKESITKILIKLSESYTQYVPILSNVKVKGEKLRVLTRNADSIELTQNKVIFIKNHNTTEFILPSREIKIIDYKISNVYSVEKDDLLANASDVFKNQILINHEAPSKYICAKISVNVSKGTYIRKLCEDIAEQLGTYGVLISLKRFRIGNYSLEN